MTYTFGNFLQLCREKKGMTQEEYCQYLSLSGTQFTKINSVTLSRWERGVSTPSISKKKALFHILFKNLDIDNISCHSYLRKLYYTMAEPLSKQFSSNYQSIIGNVPRLKIDDCEYDFKDIRTYSLEQYHYIHTIEVANHPDYYYSLELPTMQKWVQKPSSFATACSLNKEHLGHILMIKLSKKNALDIINNRRSIFSLEADELLEENDSGVYFIHLFYAQNTYIASLLSIKALLFLFENHTTTTAIAVHSAQKDAKRILHTFGYEDTTHTLHNDISFCSTLTPLKDVLFNNSTMISMFS